MEEKLQEKEKVLQVADNFGVGRVEQGLNARAGSFHHTSHKIIVCRCLAQEQS